MKKQTIFLNSEGFTIIEIVIVIAVSLVLLAGFLDLNTWHQKIFVQEEANVRTTEAVRSALLSMSENIAQATNIESSHSFNGTTYTTAGGALVLKIPSVNSSDAIIASTYDYVAYYQSNGGLFQIIEPGAGSVRPASNRLIAESVQNFSLTYNNGTPSSASAVTISLQTSITTRNSNVATHVSDTIFLRNR